MKISCLYYVFNKINLEVISNQFWSFNKLEKFKDWCCLCLHSDTDMMAEAVAVLKDTISTHDLDPRYESTECRNRVAALYLPLIAVAMEVLPSLHGYESDREEQLVSENVAMAIATSSVLQKSTSTELQSQVCFHVLFDFVSIRRFKYFGIVHLISKHCTCLFKRNQIKYAQA